MLNFRHLAPVFLIASTFFAPVQAATIDFETVIVDYLHTDDDTPFLGMTGSGSLTFEDDLIEVAGPTVLKADQLSFSITILGQTFTETDVADQLSHFAIFLNGDLQAFSFVIGEETFPLPPQIDEPGVLAIGSAPYGFGRDPSDNLLLDLWVNGPIPELIGPPPPTVPLPSGLFLIGGAIAALGGVRRRKLTK